MNESYEQLANRLRKKMAPNPHGAPSPASASASAPFPITSTNMAASEHDTPRTRMAFCTHGKCPPRSQITRMGMEEHGKIKVESKSESKDEPGNFSASRMLGNYEIGINCIETDPCRHSVRMHENGVAQPWQMLFGDAIQKLLEKEGIDDPHFSCYSERKPLTKMAFFCHGKGFFGLGRKKEERRKPRTDTAIEKHGRFLPYQERQRPPSANMTHY